MKDKIYYFQEKSNDILDLQDEFTAEEIGIYFILKAAYFKYSGELKEDNLCQRCKFFGDKDKLLQVAKKIFDFMDGILVNTSWLSEIGDIKERSEKRKLAALERWSKNKEKKPKPKPKPKPKNKPTLQDVQDYCKERNSNVDAKKFFDYYSAGDWKDAKGNQVKNWKQKLLTWESKTTNENRPESNTNQHTVDFINKMIGHSLITQIIISSPNKAQIWFNSPNDFKKYQNLDIDLRSKVKEKITEELNITNFEPKF